MSPEQERSARSPKRLVKQRQTGVMTGEKGLRDAQNSYTEFEFRQKDEGAAAVVANIPAAAPAGGGSFAQPRQPAPATPPDLRFHKFGGGYVIVSKPHLSGDDTVAEPAYTSSIAAGYAKAASLADRSKQRVSLIIMGGGGVYKEPLLCTSPLVDVYGWGNPIIEGNSQVVPTVNTACFDGLTFHTVNEFPAIHVAASMGPALLIPANGIQFSKCSFYGSKLAFHGQRALSMENCVSWQEPLPDGSFVDPALEIAPMLFEMPSPQSWWTFLKGCRLYAGLSQGAPDTGLIPVKANGWAIKVTSGIMGGPPLPNLIDFDGVFRTNSGAGAGSGGIQSGVMLDQCLVVGSAR